MKILIPLVKDSSLTVKSEYYNIPSLIEIEKKPIIQYVYENYLSIPNAEFIFVIRKQDNEQYHLGSVIKLLNPQNTIIVANSETAGAACTCLLANEYINNEDPLLIVNGEQFMNENIEKIIEKFEQRQLDGGIITFQSIHPRWSYVRLDENKNVIETAEKRPISKSATTGVYYFKQGKDYVRSAMQMIQKDVNVNGNYYICPVYNEMILEQKKIGVYEIVPDHYFSFSTLKGLSELELFLKNKKERITC